MNTVGPLSYYGPRPIDAKKQEAVLVFHGYGANAEDLLPISQAVDPDNIHDWFHLDGLYPADEAFAMTRSRSWFKFPFEELESSFRNQNWDTLENFESEKLACCLETLDAPLRQLTESYEGVHVLGFSQGGIVSIDAAFTYEWLATKLKSVVILSSCLLGRARKAALIEDPNYAYLKDVKWTQAHGVQDMVLPFVIGKRLHEWLEANVAATPSTWFQGGHEIPMNVIESMIQHFQDLHTKPTKK